MTVRSDRPGRQHHRVDLGRDPGRHRDDVDLLGLIALPEVQRERRAGVVDASTAGDPLRAMEVAERDVRRGGREGRRRDRVLLDEVRGPLAAAGGRAQHEGVGGNDVDGVRARTLR